MLVTCISIHNGITWFIKLRRLNVGYPAGLNSCRGSFTQHDHLLLLLVGSGLFGYRFGVIRGISRSDCPTVVENAAETPGESDRSMARTGRSGS